MKGTTEFENIDRFTPTDARTMTKVSDGVSFLWVRSEDYERLLLELKFGRRRLKRAGELVSSLIAT